MPANFRTPNCAEASGLSSQGSGVDEAAHCGGLVDIQRDVIGGRGADSCSGRAAGCRRHWW